MPARIRSALLPALVTLSACAGTSGTGRSGPEAAPDLGPAGARAVLRDASGREVGSAAFFETPSSGVLIRLRLGDAAPGSHAFHLHSVASCEPDFMAAGGHFNAGGGTHGILHPEGRHTGDLPNVHVPATRSLVVDVLAPGVTLEPGGAGTLFDADGSALMLHRGPDPYTRPPSGEDGERMACGAITR